MKNNYYCEQRSEKQRQPFGGIHLVIRLEPGRAPSSSNGDNNNYPYDDPCSTVATTTTTTTTATTTGVYQESIEQQQTIAPMNLVQEQNMDGPYSGESSSSSMSDEDEEVDRSCCDHSEQQEQQQEHKENKQEYQQEDQQVEDNYLQKIRQDDARKRQGLRILEERQRQVDKREREQLCHIPTAEDVICILKALPIGHFSKKINQMIEIVAAMASPEELELFENQLQAVVENRSMESNVEQTLREISSPSSPPPSTNYFEGFDSDDDEYLKEDFPYYCDE